MIAPKKRTASARSKWLLLGAAVLTVPALVAIAELVVRLCGTRIDPLSIFVASPQLRSDTQGATTGGMFEFDPLLCWRLKANLRGIWWDFTTVTTNALHLRMHRDAGAKKGIRIVVLGDSVTFGYTSPSRAIASNRRNSTRRKKLTRPCLNPRCVKNFLRVKSKCCHSPAPATRAARASHG